MKVEDSLAGEGPASRSFAFMEEAHAFLSSAEDYLGHNAIFGQAKQAAQSVDGFVAAHPLLLKTAEYSGLALAATGAVVLARSRLSRLPAGAEAVTELINQDALSIVSRRSLRLLANLRPAAPIESASPYQAGKGLQSLRAQILSGRTDPGWLEKTGQAVAQMGHDKIALHLYNRAVLERPPIAQDFSPGLWPNQGIDLNGQLRPGEERVFNLFMRRYDCQLRLGLVPEAARSLDIAESHAAAGRGIVLTQAARKEVTAAAFGNFHRFVWQGIVAERQAKPEAKIEALMHEIVPRPLDFAQQYLRRLRPTPEALAQAPKQARAAARTLHRLARNFATTDYYRQGPYRGQDYSPNWEADVGMALRGMGHRELGLRYLNTYLDQRLPEVERKASLSFNSVFDRQNRLRVVDALLAQGQTLEQLALKRQAWSAFSKARSLAEPASPQFVRAEAAARRAAMASVHD